MTMAVLGRQPHRSRASPAVSPSTSAAVHTIRRQRSISFSLEGFTSTIRLPYTLPSLIMAPVDSMFSTIFWAVPLFMRVEPVTTSGPGAGAMAMSRGRRAGKGGVTWPICAAI